MELSEIKEGVYPIRVVSRLSGVPADTIRIWQRRYQAVTPRRTDGNARRFSAEDVRRLALMRRATEDGHTIGAVASLSEAELAALLEETGGLRQDAATGGAGAGQADEFELIGQDYLDAIARFEVRHAGLLLARAALLLPPSELVLRTLIPVLRTVGDRWAKGEFGVAQEHVVSVQVRSLLDALVRMSVPREGAARLVFTTPPGQLHEFGALAGAFLALGRGFEPVYLGPELPEDELVRATKATRSRALVLSVVRAMEEAETKEVAALIERVAGRVPTWVGLSERSPLVPLLPSVRLFHRFEDFDIALTDLSLKSDA